MDPKTFITEKIPSNAHPGVLVDTLVAGRGEIRVPLAGHQRRGLPGATLHEGVFSSLMEAIGPTMGNGLDPAYGTSIVAGARGVYGIVRKQREAS